MRDPAFTRACPRAYSCVHSKESADGLAPRLVQESPLEVAVHHHALQPLAPPTAASARSSRSASAARGARGARGFRGFKCPWLFELLEESFQTWGNFLALLFALLLLLLPTPKRSDVGEHMDGRIVAVADQVFG